MEETGNAKFDVEQDFKLPRVVPGELLVLLDELCRWLVERRGRSLRSRACVAPPAPCVLRRRGEIHRRS